MAAVIPDPSRIPHTKDAAITATTEIMKHKLLYQLLRCSPIYSVKRSRFKKGCILHDKYIRYLHKTTKIVFTITSTRVNVHLYRTTSDWISVFGLCYLFDDRLILLAVCVRCKINDISNKANFSNDGHRWTEFVLSYGGEDGEYTGLGFFDTFEIFVTQDTPLFGMDIWHSIPPCLPW